MYVQLRFLECNTCFFLADLLYKPAWGAAIYIYIYICIINEYESLLFPFRHGIQLIIDSHQAEAHVAELLLHQLRIMLLYYTVFPLSATG